MLTDTAMLRLILHCSVGVALLWRLGAFSHFRSQSQTRVKSVAFSHRRIQGVQWV